MPHPKKNCSRCEKEFQPWPSNPGQKFCSRFCRANAHLPETPTFSCAHCGKVAAFRRVYTADRKPMGYDRSVKFCSKDCMYDGRRARPISKTGHLHSSGYRRLDLGDGKKIYEHKIIMEMILGRVLTPGENVHHINGQRHDNRPENLELWSRHQPTGQRVRDKIAFAIEMLRTYPEFAREAGVELHDLSAESRGSR